MSQIVALIVALISSLPIHHIAEIISGLPSIPEGVTGGPID